MAAPPAIVLPQPPTLKEQFDTYAKYGDQALDGSTITLTNSDKWMLQAGLLGNSLTRTDTGLCFFKFKRSSINFDQYMLFLNELADRKDIDVDDLEDALINCGLPGGGPGGPGGQGGPVGGGTGTNPNPQ